ncbi:MAG: hypothetical protein J5806_00325 [Lentisphaeria bacterium]|nr:hypothetical protein [Lentisphaeria bacterium]
MINSKIKEKAGCGGALRPHSLPVASIVVLLSVCCAYSQAADRPADTATSPSQKIPSLAAAQRGEYKEKERQIDEKVREGVQLELKHEYKQAIDKYLAAKAIADDLAKQTSMPQFTQRSQECAAKISNAYYFWAKFYYEQAVRSAEEADYDKAIAKLQEAAEIYPAGKEKIDELIQRYTLMKNGAQYRKKVDEVKPAANVQREKRILVRQGQVLYDSGQWDKAREKFQEVIMMDPYNETAIDYLRKINYKLLATGKARFGMTRNARNAQANWEMVTPLINYSNSEAAAQDSVVVKQDPNEKIANKLKEIIIDKISFEDVAIPTAIRYLRQCSKEKDPEKIGVNFVLRGSINEAGKGEGASDQQQQQGGDKKDEDTNVATLSMMLDNISLETIIKYICKQANLNYKIDENAVVIASKDIALDLDDVQTKVYPVEKSALTLAPDQTIVDYLKAFGIKFEAGASAVYKDYIGRLIMTNTPTEHQNLERFLNERNAIDPQVLIQTKFVEVKLNDLEELGFKYTLSRDNKNILYKRLTDNDLTPLGPQESFISDKITNVYKIDSTNRKWVKIDTTQPADTRYTNSSETATVYYTTAPLQESAFTFSAGQDSMVRMFDSAHTLVGTDDSSKTGLATTFSTWNNNGYQLNAKIYALDQADSADVLSCPRVTTMHDTTATIQLVTEQYFPSDWDEADISYLSNNVPVIVGSQPDLDDETQLGISLDVTPMVEADNETIHLIMRPLIRKFTGWDDYSYTVPTRPDANSDYVNVPNTVRMPRFEQRTVDTSVTCSDNGTIVLGGLIRDEVSIVDDKYPIIGDLPLIGRLFQTKGRNAQKYNLLIFLSCRIVKPDGSPLRERENRGLPPFQY